VVLSAWSVAGLGSSRARSEAERRGVVAAPGEDCCDTECGWSPPPPCECCGCALDACLCCDGPSQRGRDRLHPNGNPGETCAPDQYQGTDTFSCTVDLIAEGFKSCKEDCNEWCWAVAIASASGFYENKTVSCSADQCAIAARKAKYDCCSTTNRTLCDGDCNTAATWPQVGTVLEQRNPGAKFRSFDRALTETELQAQLEARQPVLVGITWSTATVLPTAFGAESGHVILILGYKGFLWEDGQIAMLYEVSDPDTGNLDWVEYDAITNYQSKGTWTNSIYRLP